MCQGGQIGGILGSLAGGALDIFAPELGIPLALATGVGGFGGTLLGDVASGKSLSASLLPAAETGAISGALAGVGNIAAGGDFFGAPASSLTGVVGSTAPTAATTATDIAAAAPTAATTQLASTIPTTIGGTTTASAAGAPAAGGGAVIGDVSTALPAATGGAGSAGANLGGSAIGAGGGPLGPTGAVGPLGTAGPTSLTDTSGAFIPGVDTAGITDVGGQVPGVSGGGSGGSFLSRIFGGGGTTAPTTITDAAGNVTGMSGGGAGGSGNFLSRGLVGDQGSLISDLTKPTTLLTGGAALLPLLQGNTIPGLAGYQNQATTLNAQGTPLAQSLTTGQLPPGAQSSLDAATRAAKAAVRSQYANMGLSGSSQEADAIANADIRAATQKVAMLEDLTKIGINEMSMATPILQNVMQTQLQQDREQQQAIARLAAALAGSTGTEKTTA